MQAFNFFEKELLLTFRRRKMRFFFFASVFMSLITTGCVKQVTIDEMKQAKTVKEYVALTGSLGNEEREGQDLYFQIAEKANEYPQDNPISVLIQKGFQKTTGKLFGVEDTIKNVADRMRMYCEAKGEAFDFYTSGVSRANGYSQAMEEWERVQNGPVKRGIEMGGFASDLIKIRGESLAIHNSEAGFLCRSGDKISFMGKKVGVEAGRTVGGYPTYMIYFLVKVPGYYDQL